MLKTEKRKLQVLKREEGQALFELVIFMPLLIIMLTYMITVGNAINGSINQQKSLRGYFYYYVKGNSRAPNREDVFEVGTGQVGMTVLAWQEELINERPFAPCYRLNSFFGELNPGEDCQDPSSGSEISQFVRIYTAYGMCADTYRTDIGAGRHLPVRFVPESIEEMCINQ